MLQGGDTCYCGNSFGGDQQLLADQCTTTCTGNSNQYCGSTSLKSVFKTNGIYEYSVTNSVRLTSLYNNRKN